MTDPRSPGSAAGPRISSLARSFGRAFWLFAAFAMSFVALVLVEALRARVPGDAVLAALPYVSLAGATVAAAIGGVVLATYVIERLAPRRLRFLFSAIALALLTTPFALPIAAELAAGDGIARVVSPEWARLAAIASLELGVLALWAWLRLLVDSTPPERGRGLRATVLVLVGALGASGALFLALGGMQAYAFLIDVVSLVFVVLAGASGYALCARVPVLGRGVAGVSLFALGFSVVSVLLDPTEIAEGREILVPTSALIARFDRIAFDPPRTGTLKLEHPERARCEQSTSTMRAPFEMPGDLPKNVLVLSIDALRSDALDWSRDGRALMPNLRRFTEGAVYAPRAVSTYPATIFAVESALTGLHPSRVLFSPSPPQTVLSRAAARADVRSAYLPSSDWFRLPAVSAFFLDGLIARRHANASMQVQAVIAELSRARANGQTYVTWAHFYEPHHPYAVHTGYDFGRSEERDRYASEIAYLDAELGRLFSFLEESGAYRDTLVIVFSDHGEALGERGYHGHHVYLDGFMTDVPLAVRAPGVAPREVRGVVELTDVAATIAHFVGVPEAAGSAGSSLLAGDPPADRVAISEAFPIRGRDLFAIANTPVRSFAELEARMALVHAGAKRYSPKVAIATADYRLIVDRETGVRELYRRGDPLVEPENVARSEPRALTTLVDRLDRWHRETAHAIYCTVRDAADPASMPAATVP